MDTNANGSIILFCGTEQMHINFHQFASKSNILSHVCAFECQCRTPVAQEMDTGCVGLGWDGLGWVGLEISVT